ncbi:MAG: type II secretion system GspH family protein [Nitrospinota bacterium]|nr:type II secretion system GspH family protein [Nitrospinota bacterium]
MVRRVRTQSGFTLLELLISLAMVTVLVTACLMMVRLATASREAGTQKTDLHQRLRVLHERLNSTLRSAHLIFVPADSESLLPDEQEEISDNSRILAFEGKPESLKLVTFSEKLMTEDLSSPMNEVRFYLQKNEETGSLEILLNERDFSPINFFKQDSPELETGQTLRIAQDVAYLKFRYYYEISEEENSSALPDEKTVKVTGQWTDKIITEPFDFKSNIGGNKSTGDDKDEIRLPRAVEISVGLWETVDRENGFEPRMLEMPPTIIPIQAGMVFERFEEEEEDESDASEE